MRFLPSVNPTVQILVSLFYSMEYGPYFLRKIYYNPLFRMTDYILATTSDNFNTTMIE